MLHLKQNFAVFVCSFLSGFSLIAQPIKVLHYSETSGYDHQTRSASFQMFQQMGSANGFIVQHDSTGQMFNSLALLQQFQVIIFSNTSGNAILDSIQQNNFQNYMLSGGSFLGIHAASDTYRHSSANGNNTGSWDWYAELLGASVQENPNHVLGTPVYKINTVQTHMLLNGLPDPWNKAEEYYYWENGYFNPLVTVLQKVEQTIGPNSMVNSYDSSRAVTWFRELSGGARVFYTALGHSLNNYTEDTLFYRLLENAMQWLYAKSLDITDNQLLQKPVVFPVPATEYLRITHIGPGMLHIYNSLGKEIETHCVLNRSIDLDVINYLPGIYFARCVQRGKPILFRFIRY